MRARNVKAAQFKTPVQDPLPAERVREIVSTLELKIVHADKQLVRVIEQHAYHPSYRVQRMLWISRRRALIEMWEFTTNKVWCLHGVDM